MSLAVDVKPCAASTIFDDPASAALFAEYEAECANPVLGPVSPRRETYEALEAMGLAQCFAVYVLGELVGFAFVVMGEAPHYGRNLATVESLYVHPEARGGPGRALMKTVEAAARETGCQAMFYTAPVGSRMAKLLLLMSEAYPNTNLVFTRRLQ